MAVQQGLRLGEVLVVRGRLLRHMRAEDPQERPHTPQVGVSIETGPEVEVAREPQARVETAGALPERTAPEGRLLRDEVHRVRTRARQVEAAPERACIE